MRVDRTRRISCSGVSIVEGTDGRVGKPRLESCEKEVYVRP
jgi:hypothetical protein